ncbi:heat shock protein DnaJ, partial [Polyplosphaeria fusca]
MATETHYQLLGVPEEVSLDQIKQAYKKLQFKYHPDRNVGKPVQVRNDADGKCKALSQALNVLSDETSRRDYD